MATSWIAVAQGPQELTHTETAILPDAGFAAPGGVAIDSQGRIYVAFPTERKIRMVDPQKGLLDELSLPAVEARFFPTRLGWAGDGLWATDSRATTVVVVDTPLNVRTLFSPHIPGRVASIHRDRILSLLPDGRLVVGTSVPVIAAILADAEVPADRRARIPSALITSEPVSELPLWLVDSHDSAIDTIALIPTAHHFGVIFPTGVGQPHTLLIQQPFADQPIYDVAPTGGYLVIVDRPARGNATTAAFHVTRVTPQGDTIATHTFKYPPVDLTDAWIQQAAIEAAGRVSDNVGEALRLGLGGLFIPDWLPPVSDLRVGPRGWLWIAREIIPGATHREWDIVDPDGEMIGTITLANHLQIRAVSGLEAWAVRNSSTEDWNLCHIRILPSN